jgi:hypothetical protein
MKIFKLLILTILFMSVYSCASKKEYSELENRYTETKKLLTKNSELLNNKSAELSNANSENQMLEQKLRDLNSNLQNQSFGKSFLQNEQLFNESNFTEINLLKTSADTLSCLSKKPTLLTNLNSGSTKFVYTIDEKSSSSANLLGLISGKLNKNERIAIIDYVEYKDIDCSDNSSLRVAAGVRLTLKIKSRNNKFKINIPSKVAAASEFGIAEVTYRIETIGFKTKTTRKILSGLGGEFNVDDYIKVLDAVNKIQLAMDEVTTVDPRVIPVERF